MADINCQLCCLCQLDTQEFLQTPKKEGFISLERDFKEYQSIKGTLPSGVTVKLNNLNDGSDIASTLEANRATYHKKCRSYYSSSRIKHLREKMEKEVPCQLSPKKLRPREDKPTNSSIQCVICQANDQSNLNKVSTGPVDENLKEWAKASKNFALTGRPVATASDAHAMDAYYHLVCYTRLREATLTANLRYILHHLILSSLHRSWPSLSIQKVYSNYQNYRKCIRN